MVEGRKIIDHIYVEISSSKDQLIMCDRCDNLKKQPKIPPCHAPTNRSGWVLVLHALYDYAFFTQRIR